VDWFVSGQWITPAIHAWAIATLILGITIYIIHRQALQELAQRIGRVESLIEHRPPAPVPPEKMGGLLLYLGDQVHKMDPDTIAPIVKYVRQEEKEKTLRVASTLVHLTETMIELFPMLGILGTVWGFAGVASLENFRSEHLLRQFAIAVETTLYGLIYFILFRLLYAGLVQAKIAAVSHHSEQFQEFLSALERRSSEGSSLPDEEGGLWDSKTS
jgi:hypothetical protein